MVKKDEYTEYLNEGENLFSLISGRLNEISDAFIRLDKTFRDENSFKELCIALAILADILGIDDLESLDR